MFGWEQYAGKMYVSRRADIEQEETRDSEMECIIELDSIRTMQDPRRSERNNTFSIGNDGERGCCAFATSRDVARD